MELPIAAAERSDYHAVVLIYPHPAPTNPQLYFYE